MVCRDDGLWYGSWGVCFTYAAWFGVEGLVACGLSTKRCAHAKFTITATTIDDNDNDDNDDDDDDNNN